MAVTPQRAPEGGDESVARPGLGEAPVLVAGAVNETPQPLEEVGEQHRVSRRLHAAGADDIEGDDGDLAREGRSDGLLPLLIRLGRSLKRDVASDDAGEG